MKKIKKRFRLSIGKTSSEGGGRNKDHLKY